MERNDINTLFENLELNGSNSSPPPWLQRFEPPIRLADTIWRPEPILDQMDDITISLKKTNINKKDSFLTFKDNLKVYKKEYAFKLSLLNNPNGMIDNVDYKTLNELLRKEKKRSLKRSRKRR